MILQCLLVFDLLGHSQEGLLDVCGALGRGFQEWNTELFGEFLFMGIKVNLCHEKHQQDLTFATEYSTTFLVVKSDLFPTSSLLTPSEA
jgi:hypothetical protein